jgi:hypothetical protein
MYLEASPLMASSLLMPNRRSNPACGALVPAGNHRKGKGHEMISDPRKLTEEDIAVIKFGLVEAGQAQAAEELVGHIEALQDELTRTHQYYEEFLIPQMEGRRIGQASNPEITSRNIQTWAERASRTPKTR